jgi:hypothetical protein
MRSTLALVAGLTLVAAPAFAQNDGDDDYEYLDQLPQQQPQQQQQLQQPYPATPQYQQPQPAMQQYQGNPQYQQPQYQPYQQPADPYAEQPTADANGQQYGYGFMGPHPIPYQYGNGYCYIEGAHSHEYAPFDQYLFREQQGYYYFVGDPMDFGYNRATYWFNGNHPIPGLYGGGYCYISWAHRHHYSPAGLVGFSYVGGYYSYSGIWPSDYYLYRDRYWGYYGGYYRNYYFGNRYYSGRPAPVWAPARPLRIAAPAGRVFGVGARPAVVGYGGGYRGAVVTGGGYRPAYAGNVGYHPSTVRYATPAYHAAPVYGGSTYHSFSSSSGFRSSAAPPVYHPSTSSSHYSAPAPVFHSSPARIGGFHR